jgi:hypothetical protein
MALALLALYAGGWGGLILLGPSLPTVVMSGAAFLLAAARRVLSTRRAARRAPSKAELRQTAAEG